MTHDYRLNWTLPALPLGPSIKPEQEKPRDEIAEFNSGDHKINGAAQLRRPSAQTPNDALTGATAESPAIVSDVVAAPPSAAPVFKVGDRVIPRAGYHGWREIWGPGTVEKVYDSGMFSVLCDSVRHHNGRPAAGGFSAGELELLSPSTTDDGWIEWRGGECPVPDDTLVEYRMYCDFQRNQHIAHQAVAGNLDWLQHDKPESWEISAYRILKDHQ